MSESDTDTIDILFNLTKHDISKVNYQEFCIRYAKVHDIMWVTNKYNVKVFNEKYAPIRNLMDSLRFHYE